MNSGMDTPLSRKSVMAKEESPKHEKTESKAKESAEMKAGMEPKKQATTDKKMCAKCGRSMSCPH